MSEPTTEPTNTYDDFYRALYDFYDQDYLLFFDRFMEQYVVDTIDGSYQVFQSFTYGEMAICFLLFCMLLLMVFKWFWEVATS